MPQSKSAVNDQLLVQMFRKMLEIRLFEEAIEKLFFRNLIGGSVHAYIGQEAVAVGVCSAMKDDDYILSTHRGHGHCLAKGGKPERIMAEILGKEAGYCKGKGGSMHVSDFGSHNLGANGIVGAGIPIAAGAGLALKLKGKSNVVACFFGDGAANTGAFHEGINLASIWKLPVIFVCENNCYAVSVPVSKSVGVPRISLRSSGYGIPGITVDGMDVVAVFNATKEAIESARDGKGPTLIECLTYRFRGHFIGDPSQYRSKEEASQWEEKDPIKRLKQMLLEGRILDEKGISAIEIDILGRLERAEHFAIESPEPQPDEAFSDVYA